jgi:putative DNA primase/helicase
MQAAGITPPDVIQADGALHRFSTNGKLDDDAGWYVHHGNGIPSGVFGDWRTGVSQTWRADIGRSLTPAENQKHRVRVAGMKRQREAEKTLRRKEAQERANFILSQAQPCEEHPYLTAKHIQANGALIYKDRVVIPLQVDGVVYSLQFISASGDKRFLMGGRVKGCYFILGELIGADVLCIAEGYSTAASIHAATDYPVAVTFNAGNVELVAKAMRKRFPGIRLVICADDDYATPGNPGLTAARQAAGTVNGALVVPDFGPNRPVSATDFNDMAAHCGIKSVKQAIVKAVAAKGECEEGQIDKDSRGAGGANPGSTKTGVSQVSGVQSNNHALYAATPAAPGEVSGVSGASTTSDSIPELDKRPTFRVYDNGLKDGEQEFKPGVLYFDTARNGDLTHTWVCSPLHVNAVTFDGQHHNFGRLLRFRNTLGQWREWAMPMEMLSGAGDDLRGELLAMGVEIDSGLKARRLLLAYLQAEPPARTMRCALQVGWCDGSFILPDIVIGPKASDVIFQSGVCGHDEHTIAGTLADWQKEISSRAVGNPLLLLALSASFAGPMLALCNAEGGGLHFVGDSSTGKTTLLEAGCSVWGGPNYRRSWRATANGMEGAAALFNDCLLGLDEISECNPHEVSAIIYALSNGRGKQRAGRIGNARAVTRWRCFVLSSGERSIETTLLEAGHKAKAGQAVRLLDVSAARAFGAWDDLHNLPSGTAFSDAIKRASATHHGHAGRAFLEKLTRDGRDFCAFLERFKALAVFAAKDGEGQEKRVAGRFAILALAGELATEYGITGWAEGDATKAAAEGFKAWRAMRGSGNDERRQILEQVSAFIERHGDSRFSKVNDDIDIIVRDRAGWWEDLNESRIYLFTAEGMQEALKSFDFKRALDVLQGEGVLGPSGADGKRAKPRTISRRSVRLYAIKSDRLGVQHGA